MPSSFIVVYSEDNLIRDGFAQNQSGKQMSQQQMQIMSELLEKAGSNQGGKLIYDKSKTSTENNKQFRGFESDPIRHEKKYYRESHAADKKKDFYSNDIGVNSDNLNANSNEVLSPGNGDIIELLDYDRVRQVNKLRRHNHKTINSLSLRYDTDTKKVVQKKQRKSRQFNPKSEEEQRKKRNDYSTRNGGEQSHSKLFISNEANVEAGTRFRRAADGDSDMDQSFNDDRGKFINEENDGSKSYNEKTKEFDSEDDMGDLSYDLNTRKSAKSLSTSDSTKQNEMIKRIFKDGYFVYDNDPDYKNDAHNYKDEINEKFNAHWEHENIEEAYGLKSKIGKKTFSIEKVESVSDGKSSDNVPTSWGAERRRHQHQKDARRLSKPRSDATRDWQGGLGAPNGPGTPQQGADPGDEVTYSLCFQVTIN